MTFTQLAHSVLVLAVTATCPSALAGDTTKNDRIALAPSVPASQPTAMDEAAADAMRPELDNRQVMKLSRQAMRHVAAAETALQQGKKSAATSALQKSQQALATLYETPALDAVVDALDEALSAMSRATAAGERVDLDPLAARVEAYEAFLEPEVVADVKQAQQRAREGDTRGAQEVLRLARHRVAADVAFLPVEEAYVHVLAAQQALANDDLPTAKRLLRDVPIAIEELQVARPLVPIRFELQAAAEAADAQNWGRSRTLLARANRDVQQLESLAKDTRLSPQLAPIAQQVAELTRQTQAGEQVEAGPIRELAKKARAIGPKEQSMSEDNQR